MGKASMTDAEPPENDSILTAETTQTTIAEERFDRVVLYWVKHAEVRLAGRNIHDSAILQF